MNGTFVIASDIIIEDSFLSIPEKLTMAFLWIVIELFGNGLLFGLIQFDWYGGDPLKRRITDQVNLARNRRKLINSIIIFSFFLIYLSHSSYQT